jgi:hypothetical protein
MADTPYRAGRNLCRCPGACLCAPRAVFNRRGGVYATYRRQEAAAFVALLINTPPLADPLHAAQEARGAIPSPREAPTPGAGLQDHQIAGLVSAITAALHEAYRERCPGSTREVVRQAALAYLDAQGLRAAPAPSAPRTQRIIAAVTYAMNQLVGEGHVSRPARQMFWKMVQRYIQEATL